MLFHFYCFLLKKENYLYGKNQRKNMGIFSKTKETEQDIKLKEHLLEELNHEEYKVELYVLKVFSNLFSDIYFEYTDLKRFKEKEKDEFERLFKKGYFGEDNNQVMAKVNSNEIKSRSSKTLLKNKKVRNDVKRSFKKHWNEYWHRHKKKFFERLEKDMGIEDRLYKDARNVLEDKFEEMLEKTKDNIDNYINNFQHSNFKMSDLQTSTKNIITSNFKEMEKDINKAKVKAVD